MLTRNLSVHEAAGLLGVAAPTIRSWLRQRRLGFVRAGRRVVIPEAEIRAFLERHAVPAREGNDR